jgi:adenosylcobyric acid synthase
MSQVFSAEGWKRLRGSWALRAGAMVLGSVMVYGTHWHGVLDNNDFRRRWLTETGPPGFLVADDIDVPARRDAQLDLMADLLTAHLDVDAIVELLENGPPQRPAIVTTLKS